MVAVVKGASTTEAPILEQIRILLRSLDQAASDAKGDRDKLLVAVEEITKR